ncbi:unnamed protein product [Phytophthora fragariaefolia]|uniref:Unnamed protein product n=1 Tax=Phytophthora fragariaefolia TaxID=1490495 RepID=A0A9W6XW21_9STRA|nr:unnamed protein product [Phytophthora fragariaefolia]
MVTTLHVAHLNIHSLSPQALDASISRALNKCGLVALLRSVQLQCSSQQQLPNETGSTPPASEHHSNPEVSAAPTTTLRTQNYCLTRVRADFAILDFIIPSMSLERAWEHWCCGTPSGDYGPLRSLEWQDLANSKTTQKTFTLQMHDDGSSNQGN